MKIDQLKPILKSPVNATEMSIREHNSLHGAENKIQEVMFKSV